MYEDDDFLNDWFNGPETPTPTTTQRPATSTPSTMSDNAKSLDSWFDGFDDSEHGQRNRAFDTFNQRATKAAGVIGAKIAPNSKAINESIDNLFDLANVRASFEKQHPGYRFDEDAYRRSIAEQVKAR